MATEKQLYPGSDPLQSGRKVYGKTFYKEVTITSAELLALRATPKTLVAAPGAGRVIEFVNATIIYDYATAGYTESAANLAFRYTDGSGASIAVAESTGFIDQTADKIISVVPLKDIILVPNAALVLHNNGAGEVTGGAGVLRVKVGYKVHLTGL